MAKLPSRGRAHGGVLFAVLIFSLSVSRFRLGFFLARALAAFRSLPGSTLRFHLARVIDQFNNREFSAITGTPAHLDDARVAARTILETFAQFVKQTL